MEIPQHWRLNAQRYSLTGTVCSECHTAHFPPRAVCSVCAHSMDDATQEAHQIEALDVEQRVRTASRNGRVVLQPASNPA